ncbi:MAG: DUF935 family protein [Candidatus Egerieousia sp.]
MNTTTNTKKKKKRKIESGGITQISGERKKLDIILQSPQIFHFDIAKYMAALNSASAIDCYSRAKLYDIYNSVLLDLHLSGIIDKRLIGVSRIPIEFRRDGKPDEAVNEHLKSPWFREFVKDILWSKFWGFSLMQFYRDEAGWIQYDLIDRKHYDPVRREILRYETDNTGIPIENFSNTLYVGTKDRGLGLLAKLAPMVLYKRGNTGDWAEFCQIFGIPIREYTYDAGDEDARRNLIHDAMLQGASAIYIHPTDSTLNLIESANKSGTVDLYERFYNMCNTEMSIAVLGNTLTTDSKSTGTQALGKVHQDEENEIKEDDRDYVLDVLNYEMTEIFQNLGVNTAGGRFTYVTTKTINKTEQLNVVSTLTALGLPISDDYLYESFDVDKPEDYESRKAEMLRQQEEERLAKAAAQESVEKRLNDDLSQDKKHSKESLKDRLRRFFVPAPQDGAPLEF